MAKQPVMRGGGGSGETQKERLAREHRAEKRKRAAKKAIEASKPGPKGWEKVGRAIVSARDKALEHPVGQAAVLLAGRGRGRPPLKGRAAPKLGRKLPKFKPKKPSKARRDYLEDPRSTRAGGGDMHPMHAPKYTPRVGGRRTSRPSTGIERAEQAAMTKGTDPGYKLKKKAKAPAKGRRKSGTRVDRLLSDDMRSGAIPPMIKGKTPRGRGRHNMTPGGSPGTYKLNKKAPAKGKRTKMTSRHKGKLPLMGVKPRIKPARTPGQARVDYVKQETPRSAARTLQREKDWLGSVKEIKSKRQRKERRTLSQNPSSDSMYSNPIPRQRKKVLQAKKVKEKADRGERVWTKKAYDFRLKDWPGDPRLGKMQHKPTRQAKSGAEKPKATGQKDQARFEGRAHITGPKVKTPKAKTPKAAPRLKDKVKRAPKPGSETWSEIKTMSKGMDKASVMKLIKRKPYLTKAQKAALLAIAGTAIGAEKRRRNTKKEKSGWPEGSKYQKVAPDFFEEVAKPIKKKRRKETAAQKNKRLNIRFKSAGQRQAEKYPPKEK